MNSCFKLLTLLFILFGIHYSFSQTIPDYGKNCPDVPCVYYPDTNAFISTDEIQLGSGVVTKNNQGSGAYNQWTTIDWRVPCNKPTFAIAMAHSWILFRNLINPNININIVPATLINETSGGACIPASKIDMSCYTKTPENFPFQHQFVDYGNDFSLASSDGCFQIDVLGRATLKEWLGSSNCGSVFGDDAKNRALITGESLETGALGKFYYALISNRRFLSKGYNSGPVLAATPDKDAYTKLMFAGFNQGPDAMDAIAERIFTTNRAAAMTSSNWFQSNLLGPIGYSMASTHYFKILSNQYTPKDATDKQRWLGWYDYPVTWSIMTEYMDKVFAMYSYNTTQQSSIKNKVKAVFDKQKDVNGNVSFRYKLGPVLDMFVKSTEVYDPLNTILNCQAGNCGCKNGCVGPMVRLWTNTPKTVCKGNSVELETVYGAGYTYTWLKDEALISNPNPEKNKFYATQSGVYSVIVANEKGCAIRDNGSVTVTIDNSCSTCDLLASGTITKNSCTGIKDGKIEVALSGADYISTKNYVYKWTYPDGTVNTFSNKFLNNVSNGNYFLEVTEVGNATCKAFKTIKVEETTPFYSKLILSQTVNSCSTATVKADVVSNPPKNCNYSFKMEKNTCPNSNEWISSDMRLYVKLNGVSIGGTTPTPMDWGSGCTPYLTTNFGVTDGDKIDVYIGNVSGSSFSSKSFKFSVTDPKNQTTSSNTIGMTFPGNQETLVLSATAKCDMPVPSFNFTWKPIPSPSPVSTTISSSASVSVLSNTYYTIEAVSPSAPTCKLKDSVEVKYTCPGFCTAPTTAPIFKSANYSACAPATGTNVIVTLPTGVYYQLFNSTTNAPVGTSAGPTTAAGEVTIFNVAAGSYKVRIASSVANLTSTGCFTPSVGTGTVTINSLPTLTISSLPNDTVCIGTSVTLKGGGANTYLWDKSVVDNTAFTATTSSTYTLTGTDNNGCQAFKTINLVVNALPTVKATATPSATICQGSKVTLIGTGATNYTWDNGITNNVAFIPVTKTLYTVTGTDAKGCTARDTITVKLSSPPTAAITTTALGYCVGGSGITLTAQAVPGATYQWYKNGTSQGAANTTNTFANATAGNWTVKVAIGTCADSLKTAIQVVANLLPNANVTSRATALCLNDTVSLKGASTTSGVTYAWDNGIMNNSPITLDNASKFKTYTLTVTSKENCKATTSVTLTQKAATKITTNPTGFTACVGENKTLTIAATGAGTLTYQWYLGPSTVGTNSATLNLNNIQTSSAGTYKVSVTGDCGTLNSTDAVVTVNDKPQITKQPAKSGGCVGSSAALNVTATGATTYQWIKTPSNNVGVNSNILNFSNLQNTDAGIYKVNITNSCGTTTSDTASIATPSNEIPDVELFVSKSQVCEGSTVQLTAIVKQGGGTSPKFTFKDELGNIIGAENQLSNTVTTSALTKDHTFTVTLLSNSSCLALGAVNPITSLPVTVKVDAKPTNVSAGADKSICTNTFTLAANVITVGTGKWTVKSGTGNFDDNTQNNTILSNLSFGANEYKWTVTNGVCSPISDSVIITRTRNISTPNAGPDIKICEGNTINLSASALQVGETGKWTITPSTLTIENEASPTTTIVSTTGNAGTYSVKWTIGNGVCPDQADSLNLTIDQLPSTAILANETLPTCATQLNLNAVAPTVGTGIWEITSGNGSIAAADTNNPTALITGLSSGGTTTLTWSVKNGTCNQANSKTLTINQVGNLSSPVILIDSNPITGTFLEICKNKTYSFTASTPTVGETGTWTSTSKAIAALSGNTQTQNLTITGIGVDTITWTISTTVPGCTPQSKKVALVISDVPAKASAIVGADTVCTNELTTQSVNQEANTNYTWNLQNAIGSSNSNVITAKIGIGLQAILTVTPSNTCGNGTATSKTIMINPKPDAPVFATRNTTSNPQINPNTVCAQSTVNYAVNTVTGETYTWSWKNPSTKTYKDIATGSITTTASNIANSETDTLIVTASNLCGTGVSNKLPVSFNSLPSYTVPNDTIICQGSALPKLKLSFKGKAGYIVNFTFNGTPVSVTAPADTYLLTSQVGTYQITSVTDANGCANAVASKTVTVSQTALPETSYTVTGETVCEGKDANIQISGSEVGILYNLYKKGTLTRTKVGSIVGTGSAISSTIKAASLNSSNIIEVDAVGCTAVTLQDTATIIQLGKITAINGKTLVCDSDKTQIYSLNPVAGATGYSWSIDNDAEVIPQANTSSATVTLGTNPNYTLTATAILPTGACTNSKASLFIAQKANYKGDTLVLSEDTVCAGASITVNMKNKTADAYRNWSFPLNTKINSVNSDSTKFTITLQEIGLIQVKPYHACDTKIQSLKEYVEVYKSPQAYAGTSQKHNGFPTAVQLKGTNLAAEEGVNYKYDWTVSKGNAVLSMPTSLQTTVLPKDVETKYLFTITTPNEASCSASSEVTLLFEVMINPPLIFSPNGDGKNDFWEINELEFFPNASIEIFNQWGTKVFSKNGGYLAEPWNGKYDNGAEAPIATYYYIISPNKDGFSNKVGSVTIVK